MRRTRQPERSPTRERHPRARCPVCDLPHVPADQSGTTWGPITDQDVEALAAKADVDPRTMVRALAGLPVRGRTGVRVARVLAEHRNPRHLESKDAAVRALVAK